MNVHVSIAAGCIAGAIPVMPAMCPVASTAPIDRIPVKSHLYLKMTYPLVAGQEGLAVASRQGIVAGCGIHSAGERERR